MKTEKLKERLLAHTLENELRLTDNGELAHNDGQHTTLRPVPELTLDDKVIEHVNRVVVLNDDNIRELTNAPKNTTFYGTLNISEDVLSRAENVGLRLTPESYIDGEVGMDSDGFLDVPNISASDTIGECAGKVIAPYASTKKSIGALNHGDVIANGATAENYIGLWSLGDVIANHAKARIIGYENRADVIANGATAETIGYINLGDVIANGATAENYIGEFNRGDVIANHAKARIIGLENRGDVEANGATAKYIGD